MAKLDRSGPEPVPVEGARWLPLGNGKFALVDDADYEWASKVDWSIREGYVTATIYLHRAVMERAGIVSPRDGNLVDHKDHNNKLDCRKNNLRPANHASNAWNQKRRDSLSGFKGVQKKRSKWVANIKANGIRYHLGTFNSPEEAAKAHDDAARLLHGEFAVTNYVRD